MSQHTFVVPFSSLRGLLPRDGERQVVWNGTMNKWKQNRIPFERHETAEIAFGRAIRAQQKHRKSEKSLAPGISAQVGRIHIRGGWAVHKDVPVHNDYFDGTFRGDVFVSVRNGHIDTDLQNFHFDWNASLAAKIIDFTGVIRNIVIGIIRSRVRNVIAARLREEVQAAVADLIRRVPQAEVALDALTVVVLKDALAVTISYEEKAAPLTVITGGRRTMESIAASGVAAKATKKAATKRASATSSAAKVAVPRRTTKAAGAARKVAVRRT